MIGNSLVAKNLNAWAMWPDSLLAFFRRHQLILIILFLTFLMRFVLAPWNSYRLDELYSIKQFGSNYATVSEAVKFLADTSAHPPLYQIVLFYYVKGFGDSEIVTRTLSNLLVTASAALLYVFGLKWLGARVAILSSLLLSLSQLSWMWGLDTRSYALTMFLTVLSTLLLMNYVRELRDDASWRRTVLNWTGLGLLLVNLALLFTHYYNIFFLASQAAFLFCFFIYEQGPRGLLPGLTRAAAVFGTQLGLFLVSWGPVMIRTVGRYEETEYAVGSPSHGPFGLLHAVVAAPNLGDSHWVSWFVALLLLVLLGGALRARKANRGKAPFEQVAALHLVLLVAGPCIVSYLLFWMSGEERLEPRYFIFTTAPLMAALALALDRGIRLLPAEETGRGAEAWRRSVRAAALLGLAVTLALVTTRGFEGAAWRKKPFRRIAESIAEIVRGDPYHRYLIYEASSLPESMLEFYLEKARPPLKTFGTIIPSEEETRQFRFEQREAEIAQYDYLVVAFPHRRFRLYPRAIQRLGEKYETYLRAEDPNNFGFIIYKIRPGP